MSAGTKYPIVVARALANEVMELLAPHCYRIEIAGSIRRGKEEISDIEIVAIPKPYQTGLFSDGISSVIDRWKKVKGELEYGKCKYTQRILPFGIRLDLFFADETNWGNIMLIRTGDWEFSKKFVGILLPRNGYRQEGGYLKYKDRVIPCPEERDMFSRAGIYYIEPKDRNANAIH